ncbi:hypothetical protein FHX44_11605 [Pseudonocardia hierapolitana]|uniref:Uncharacterized protein n=1 Tax=Pseudonocardia hierapolitana TaxID=1128676 RepID=A0A561SIN0_9PSEU|nr:hypothetical protein [Pseudonocardia hierapolitana]TWF74723.1 hypothetical protein FHX44_11605 [Pseudonocardia hierapolitana]
MQLDLGPGGPVLDGVPVPDPAALEAVLGPPSRTEAVGRAIPGAEDRSTPERVSVWDEVGLIAAPGLLSVAVGDNLLDEPIWPRHRFPGPVQAGGVPLDPETMAVDPLREQRRTRALEDGDLTVITDWRGRPTKFVWTRREL